MQLLRNKMPNAVTFVYENGDLYTFILDFNDGENYGMLQERFSNPLNWDGIWLAAGLKTLHFINLQKVRHFYFSILSEDEIALLKSKVNITSKIDTITGVGLGVLVSAKEIGHEHPAERVRDIGPIPPVLTDNENSPAK